MATKRPDPQGFTAYWKHEDLARWDMNLCWTHHEYGITPNGKGWIRAHGLVWSIESNRIVASIDVFNGEYTVTVQCQGGLDRWALEAVEAHLESLSMTKSEAHGRI